MYSMWKCLFWFLWLYCVLVVLLKLIMCWLYSSLLIIGRVLLVL